MMFSENEKQKNFYLSLGRFIEIFSIVENNARFVLMLGLKYTGDPPIKKIDSIKLSDIIRKSVALFRDDDRLANRDWLKLGEISLLRNKVMHTITREDENGFYVGQESLSTFQKPENVIRVDSEDLDKATADLYVINSAFNYRFHQLNEHRYAKMLPEMEDAMIMCLAFSLRPWQYNLDRLPT